MELRSIVPPTENERSPDLTEPIYKTVAPHSIMRNTTGGRRRRASQRRRRRHKLRPGVGSALSGDKLKRRVVEAAHRRRERPVKRPLENKKNAHPEIFVSRVTFYWSRLRESNPRPIHYE